MSLRLMFSLKNENEQAETIKRADTVKANTTLHFHRNESMKEFCLEFDPTTAKLLPLVIFLLSTSNTHQFPFMGGSWEWGKI